MPPHPQHPPQPHPRPPAVGTGSSHEPDTLAGLILSLPPRKGLPAHPKLHEGCYEHPVVVLSQTASSRNDVVVLLVRHPIPVLSQKRRRSLSNWLANSTVQVTSFNKTNIHDRFPGARGRDRRRRLGYLPIYPATHPDTTLQLRLDRCPPLRLKSYVNIRNKHTVPLTILRAYNSSGIRFALASASYRELVGQANFQSPTSFILSVDAGSIAITGDDTFPSKTAPLKTGRPVPEANKSRPRQSPTYATVLVSSRTPVPGEAPISARPATESSSNHPSTHPYQPSTHPYQTSTHPYQPSTHVTVLVASQAPIHPSAPVPARTQPLPATRSLFNTHGSASAQPGLPVAYGTFPAASAMPVTPRASVNITRFQLGAENRPLLATERPSLPSTRATPRTTTSSQPDTLPLYYSNRLDNDGDGDSQNGRPPAAVVFIMLGFLFYMVWSTWVHRDDIGSAL